LDIDGWLRGIGHRALLGQRLHTRRDMATSSLTEAAIEWWGKAGQRSLDRSALAEAAAQFTRALAQIATLPGTPRTDQASGRAHNALLHVKGYAAAETKAAAEQARSLIEQAESLGEPLEDPLLLFSVLYAF
jgi:predicted ATPase